MLGRQAARFVAVGVLTALLDFTAYRLLLVLDVPLTPAKAAGFVLGTTASYLLNRAWTFGADQHALHRFLALYAVTLVLNVAANAAAHAALVGVPGRVTIAWVLAQALASVLNFVGMRSFVFPAHRTGGTP